MSLRARLSVLFAVVLIIPVLIVGVALTVVLRSNAANRTDARVANARAAIGVRLAQDCTVVSNAARAVAKDGASPAAVSAAANSSGADVATVASSAGVILNSATRGAATASALIAAAQRAVPCSATTGLSSGVLVGRATGPNHQQVTVGIAVDPSLSAGSPPAVLTTLAAGLGVQLTVAAPGNTLPLSTAGDVATAAKVAALGLAQARSTATHRGGGFVVSALPLGAGGALVVSAHLPSDAMALGVLAGIVVLALLFAALSASWLTQRATKPLSDLSAVADRVAAGDLGTRLPVTGDVAVDRLAAAFNSMTESLNENLADLRISRNELQANVSRLGDTLSGTHDLERILTVIVDTAMVSVRATAGALLLTSAAADHLYLPVGRGLEGRLPDAVEDASMRGRRISAKWRAIDARALLQPPGVAARVAASGLPVHGRIGPGGLELLADEPRADTVLAVPLESGSRVTGVLALYDREDGHTFDQRDLEIVQGFLAQATVAIDNVLMHQEAQRLSITDGLTGLWNYRYVIMALAREVERAVRFDRPLAVLMLDLDRFKRVNDNYGHQRGDAVLTEVANRVRTVVRDIDILARYGGEELILVLPETDLQGAEFLAGRVIDAIRTEPMGAPGEELLTMTASVGVAVFPEHGDSARSLLRAADSALYAAKGAGRDCWRVAASVGPEDLPPIVPPRSAGAWQRAEL